MTSDQQEYVLHVARVCGEVHGIPWLPILAGRRQQDYMPARATFIHALRAKMDASLLSLAKLMGIHHTALLYCSRHVNQAKLDAVLAKLTEPAPQLKADKRYQCKASMGRCPVCDTTPVYPVEGRMGWRWCPRCVDVEWTIMHGRLVVEGKPMLEANNATANRL